MGFLYSSEIEEKFLNHLKLKGPLSIRGAVAKYWRSQPKESFESTDSQRHNAQHAMEFVISHHLGEGHIKALNEAEFFEFLWFEEEDRRTYQYDMTNEAWWAWRKSGVWEGIWNDIDPENPASEEDKRIYLERVRAFTDEQMGQLMIKEMDYFNQRTYDDDAWAKWGYVNIQWVLTGKALRIMDSPESLPHFGGIDL